MLNKLSITIHNVVRLFSWLGALAASATVIVIIINILGRFLFKSPLHGTIELVELMTVLVVYSVLPYTELYKRHVHVELLVSQFSGRVKDYIAAIMSFAGTVFFLVMSWQAAKLAWENISPTVRETDTLSIPFAPFVFMIAIGSLLLGLEMLLRGLQSLSKEKVREERS